EPHLRWHDERLGMPDDWITALARAGGTLYAGTFVVGLARWDGHRWKTIPALDGQNVTALAAGAHGVLYVATRHGLFRIRQGDLAEPLNPRYPFLETELQALLVIPGGLWVGGRTGLYF